MIRAEDARCRCRSLRADWTHDSRRSQIPRNRAPPYWYIASFDGVAYYSPRVDERMSTTITSTRDRTERSGAQQYLQDRIMKRQIGIATATAAFLAASLAAAAQTPPPTTPQTPPSRTSSADTVTVTGCVQPSSTASS